MIFCGFIFFQPQAYSAQIYASQDSSKAHALATSIQKSIPDSKIIYNISDINTNELVVTIGVRALKQLPKYDDKVNILATYIKSIDYQHYKTEEASNRPNVIFVEPDPLSQLDLAATLIPNARIVAFESDHDSRLRNKLSRKAKLLGVELSFLKFSTLDRSFTSPEFLQSNVLLASPNSNIYIADNIWMIMHSTTLSKRALIGYSSGWVKSGGLASLYSNDIEMKRCIIDGINKIRKTPENHFESYCRPFRIIINETAASSLDITKENKKKALEKWNSNAD